MISTILIIAKVLLPLSLAAIFIYAFINRAKNKKIQKQLDETSKKKIEAQPIVFPNSPLDTFSLRITSAEPRLQGTVRLEHAPNPKDVEADMLKLTIQDLEGKVDFIKKVDLSRERMQDLQKIFADSGLAQLNRFTDYTQRNKGNCSFCFNAHFWNGVSINIRIQEKFPESVKILLEKLPSVIMQILEDAAITCPDLSSVFPSTIVDHTDIQAITFRQSKSIVLEAFNFYIYKEQYTDNYRLDGWFYDMEYSYNVKQALISSEEFANIALLFHNSMYDAASSYAASTEYISLDAGTQQLSIVHKEGIKRQVKFDNVLAYDLTRIFKQLLIQYGMSTVQEAENIADIEGV